MIISGISRMEYKNRKFLYERKISIRAGSLMKQPFEILATRLTHYTHPSLVIQSLDYLRKQYKNNH